MKKSVLFGVLFLTSQFSMAAINPVYLQCPNFDERAPDLIIVLNEANGTAALQSKLGGSGFNFSEPASFGPNEVVWSKTTGNFKHIYSVNRSSLIFESKTFSGMTGENYSEKTECKISKSKASNKF